MFRLKLLKAVALTATLITVTAYPMSRQAHAQPIVEPDSNEVAASCEAQPLNQKIESVAAALATPNNASSAEVEGCYATLSLEEKAKVFEIIAQKRGLLEQLNGEVRNHKRSVGGRSIGDQVTTFAPGDWRQLIEHVGVAYGEIRTPNGDYLGENVCAPGRGQEYVFQFEFSGAVSNPDGLKTNSADLLVDSMLAYCQLNNYGVDGFGNVSVNRVYVCIGNTGIGIAGYNNVYYNMRIIKS